MRRKTPGLRRYYRRLKMIWGLAFPLLVVSNLCLFVQTAQAQSSENIEVHGFLLGNFAGRTTGAPATDPQGDYLLAEERLRLDLSTWSESVDASAEMRLDFVHDALERRFDVDVREAYVDYAAGRFDFRLGRQITTWGVGDLLFINDVFPKDWVSFFSGRPLEYLKIGADGFRTRFSSRRVNLDVMVIPFFTPDNVPTTERFSLSDPFAGVAVRDERKPRQRYENAELALRLYRRVGSFDVSVYAYDGFWRTPGFEADPPASPERVTAVFPSLSVLGTSAQGSVLDGILSLEYGYYDSDAVGGRQPFGTPDSQNRFLVGYQREVRQDLNLGVQYYAEVSRGEIRTSAEVEAPRGDQYRDTATLRLEQLLRNQTWRVAVFTFFSPSDGDYLLQPQGSYRLSDELSLAFGANIFGGETDTFLGRFDRNDNLYGSVRFDF